MSRSYWNRLRRLYVTCKAADDLKKSPTARTTVQTLTWGGVGQLVISIYDLGIALHEDSCVALGVARPALRPAGALQRLR
jgi:hypothetical protein